ncbi:lysosome-associated membrane glycoprotein 3 isoform X2 [Latimeria chalumnae]|uniref:lysosome-associated membrane glycoprotein 3 isoform X2 n=1 Tax=Latimeria chalumnae TaxID=7897 RepID=UPI00313D640A
MKNFMDLMALTIFLTTLCTYHVNAVKEEISGTSTAAVVEAKTALSLGMAVHKMKNPLSLHSTPSPNIITTKGSANHAAMVKIIPLTLANAATTATTHPMSNATTHSVTTATTHPMSNATTHSAATATTHPMSNATTHSAATATTHPMSNATTHSAATATTHPMSNATTHSATTATTHPMSNATTHSATTATTHPMSNATTHLATTATMHPMSNATTHSANVTTPAVHTTTTVGPTLSPKQSSPQIGNYTIKKKEKICIMALMGIELIVKSKDKKESYFNIVPNVTKPAGLCNEHTSWLHLGFSGGYVNFTFTKEKSQYYVSAIEVELDPVKLETKSLNENYHGKIEKQKLFPAKPGNSYKCKSKETMHLGDSLDLVTVGVQLQAFDFDNEHFGKVEQCSADYHRLVAIIAGCVVGVIILAIIIYVVWKRLHPSGYQRI